MMTASCIISDHAHQNRSSACSCLGEFWYVQTASVQMILISLSLSIHIFWLGHFVVHLQNYTPLKNITNSKGHNGGKVLNLS